MSLSIFFQPAAPLHFDLLAVGASVSQAELQQENTDRSAAGSHHSRFTHLTHSCSRFRDLAASICVSLWVSPECDSFSFLVHLNCSPSSEEATRNESVLKVLGGMVMSSYAKYWIYVCGGMFIMVSFAGKLVGYKIVYMLLLLMCLCLYQVGWQQPSALAESHTELVAPAE